MNIDSDKNTKNIEENEDINLELEIQEGKFQGAKITLVKFQEVQENGNTRLDAVVDHNLSGSEEELEEAINKRINDFLNDLIDFIEVQENLNSED